MRCKKHFSDVSSSVGVCASCLRERLIDAQSRLIDDDHQQQLPPPLVFPRSVSPYISRRKSDASVDANEDLSGQLHQRRFFSTPRVDSTATKKRSKFHAIANLFRSRSGKSAPDPLSNPSISTGSRRNSALRLFALDETSAYDDGRRGRWFGSRKNRGMSPDTRGVADEPDGGSPSRFSPEQWKRTPSSGSGSTRTGQARVKSSPARSHVASGIGICLSPLMRPSPIRNWSGKGVGPVEYSGEIRSTVKPHLSTAASLGANRSRKLADLGRFNNNR